MAGPSTTTGGIEQISGASFIKVITGTSDKYTEFLAVGPPPIGLGIPGDIYVDTTPKRHVLYGFTTEWRRWKGPQKKKDSDVLRHPKHPGIVLWATAGKRGWISLEVLKKKRQTDTENSILTEQIKADRKNQVSGTPFQAERVQSQPTSSALQASQSVGPATLNSVPRETRRASTGTASYPLLGLSALDKWVAGLENNSTGANEPSLTSPVSSNESPIPQNTSISSMCHAFSLMHPPISPIPVIDSPISFPPSMPTTPPVHPPTPNVAPPHFDLTKISRSLSSPKSRTNAPSSLLPGSFISPPTLTPRGLDISSPSTKVTSKSQCQVLDGSPQPKISRASGPSQSSPTGLQHKCSIPHPPLSPVTQKRKRVQSPIRTSPAASSLVRMEDIPAHDEACSRPSKAVKTTHRFSSVASPSKESASRVTTQCSVERKNSQPKKLPAIVIDLTLSDDDDVSVPVPSPTAPSPTRKMSAVAPSPSPSPSSDAPSPLSHISPIAPSPPPRVPLEPPSHLVRILPVAPSPPPAVFTLEDTSLGESDVPMGDGSLAETLELQYPVTEESEIAPASGQYQADLMDDVTIYGTLGFKAHHLHAVFQMNEVMVCRLCQEEQAVFDRDASFDELASHCETSHGEACDLIVALTSEQTKAWLELALVA
ncbi:hypothetical protein EDD18DRAFT_731081 [Armillaria luteobubalina]|uniref:Uncharacterized protein n=1 Tax=Armillaria luteobubalina TaxID=153913 RepID=A0AA39QE94_9AGAR|nr:hypothetical protein EDD18DRAFT_731081 [Armillaria luteobubalina]